MARSTAARLTAYQNRYRQLAERIAEIGFIAAGSITHRHCRAGPPQLHGPYWQWTAKIDGKTVTRRLTPADAQRYQQWIANDRQLRALIDQMRQVAAKATEMILEEDRHSSAEV